MTNIETESISELQVKREMLFSLLKRTKERRFLAANNEAEDSKLADEITEMENQIQALDKRIGYLRDVLRGIETVQEAGNKVSISIRDLRDDRAQDFGDLFNTLEQQVSALVDATRKTVESASEVTRESGFEPKMTVVRPIVKMVDANLAYRFTETQGDFNIALGLASLFLGSSLTFAVSWLVASSASTPITDPHVIIVYQAATIFSTLISLILGLLAFRFWNKSIRAKRNLETAAEERELALHAIFNTHPQA